MTPERYAELKKHWAEMKQSAGFNFWGWDEAVTHIDALQAEIARLREALKQIIEGTHSINKMAGIENVARAALELSPDKCQSEDKP